MGNAKWYNKEPGHEANQYHQIGETVTINGVRGHIIANNDDPEGLHTSMPAYAGESDMYFRYRNFKEGETEKTVVQGTLYIGHKKICDFDWGHEHTNKGDGRVFQEGVVHVQFYGPGPNGSRIRINEGDARYMNNSEIKKYGPILKEFGKNIKFRPSKKRN